MKTDYVCPTKWDSKHVRELLSGSSPGTWFFSPLRAGKEGPILMTLIYASDTGVLDDPMTLIGSFIGDIAEGDLRLLAAGKRLAQQALRRIEELEHGEPCLAAKALGKSDGPGLGT